MPVYECTFCACVCVCLYVSACVCTRVCVGTAICPVGPSFILNLTPQSSMDTGCQWGFNPTPHTLPHKQKKARPLQRGHFQFSINRTPEKKTSRTPHTNWPNMGQNYPVLAHKSCFTVKYRGYIAPGAPQARAEKNCTILTAWDIGLFNVCTSSTKSTIYRPDLPQEIDLYRDPLPQATPPRSMHFVYNFYRLEHFARISQVTGGPYVFHRATTATQYYVLTPARACATRERNASFSTCLCLSHSCVELRGPPICPWETDGECDFYG